MSRLVARAAIVVALVPVAMALSFGSQLAWMFILN